MPSDFRQWEKLQRQRGRRCLALALVAVALAVVALAWSVAPPPPQSNHLLVTSSPGGAEIWIPAMERDPVRMGQRVQGKITRHKLGTTPFRLTLHRDSQGRLQGYTPNLLLRLPGYQDASLLLPLSPVGGQTFDKVLQADWPTYAWLAPLHWAAWNPFRAGAWVFFLMALSQLGLYALGARAWRRQALERKRRGAVPGAQVGAYRLRVELGRGGMGRVFLAEHVDSGEVAALKMLFESASLDAGRRQSFLREANALRELRHSHIVLLLEWGEDLGQLYLVQEYVAGHTLRVSWSGPQPWDELCQQLSGVVSAMVYLHKAGWVHRDLKPENLILSEGGRVKLVDFGIAAVDGTIGGRGTPAYMAPEALAGETVDWRADLYSLGVLIFEGLTGNTPYAGAASAFELMRCHLEEPVPSLPDGVAPPELEALLQRLLAKKPQHRLTSPDELAEAWADLRGKG